MSRFTFQDVVRALASLATLAVATAAARGGTVSFQLGEQDFPDGKSPVYSSEIRAAGAGEAYPFDGTIFGNDVKTGPGSLGAFEYEHRLDFGGSAVKAVSATLEIGLIDIDSPSNHAFDTVAIEFDGVVQSSEKIVGISPRREPSSVEVVNFQVPPELLADGALRVSVTALRPGYGNLGNAIEADYSRLTVQTVPAIVLPPDGGPSPSPVPLPAPLIPACVMLGGLAVIPRKRLRKWLNI
jgi:hypothetical protein